MMKVFNLCLVVTGCILNVSAYVTPNGLKCARYCKESRNDYGYEIGSTYSYTYSVNISTYVNSTPNDNANVKNIVSLSALVDIHVLSTCNYKMEILSADSFTNYNKLVQQNEDKKLTVLLMEQPLHFSFHNGKIDTVCSTMDESTEILNIKKAILSAFQNSMQNLYDDSILYETDVSGNCETEYKVTGNSPLRITKRKNLEACGHRNEKYFSWQSKPYNKKQATSLPLLRSTQTCSQTFTEDTILKSTVCEERHLFQPFSNGEQGAVTILTQELQLVSKQKQKLNTDFPLEFKHSTLLFKKSVKEDEKIDNTNTVNNLLNQLDVKTKDGIDAEVPKIFSHLVDSLGSASKDALITIFDSIKSSKRKKKFFVDAMPLITTVDGIEVMKKLKLDNELTQSQFDSWISSLLFIKHPTLDIIQAISPLIQSNNSTKQKAVLTISGLLYSYCEPHSQCEANGEVRNILNLIEEPLIQGCVPVNPAMQENILLALKGIGNVGRISSNQYLRNCYMSTDAPLEIRLASIAAHRRMNCDRNENLEDLDKLFADIKQNTEIRIASYLAIMQCSSYAVFTKIKDVLQKEETNQVGSFVWTHLTNLQETSSQWKQNLRQLVENEFLKNKFNTDIRKYSRNYEASTFFDSINAGVSLESNVIFTSDSYLPKSGMLNFTLDLFGETINVFEIGGRISGFEDIVENLFGPDGYFPENSIKALLENAKNEHELTNQIEKMGEKFKSQNILRKSPSGTLYTKVFGNEYFSSHFTNLSDIFGEPITMRNIFDILMKLFRESDIEYSKSLKFIDTTYKIPTILGFPLELSVNGTAILGLTVKGKIDLKDIWSYKLAIEGKVSPSIAVEIVGAMTVDAIFTKVGLKSVNVLNSNTYVDGRILIDKKQLVDLKLNMPNKQMDIINVYSDVYLIENERLEKISDVTTNVEQIEKCTEKSFRSITGLELCYNIKYVNASMEKYAPYFPLTGSFKFAVKLKKVDTFNNYRLQWKSQLEKDKGHYLMSLYIDTPNSQVNRKFNTSVLIDIENKHVEVKLESPFVMMGLNGKMSIQSNKCNLNLNAIYNYKEIMKLDSTFEHVNNYYKVNAVANYKEEPLASMSGNISRNHDGYNIILTFVDISRNVIDVKFSIQLNSTDYNIFSELISTHGLYGKLMADMSMTPESLSISSSFYYKLNNKEDQLSINFNWSKIKHHLQKDIIYLNITSASKPNYNTLISYDSQRGKMFFDTNAVLTIFGITWESHQLFKFHRPKGYLDFALLSALTCQMKNIDYQIILAHNSSADGCKTHSLIQMNKTQRLEAFFKYEVLKVSRHVNIMVYYPKQAWVLNGELNKLNMEEIEIKLKGQRNVNEKIRDFLNVNGKYINSTKDQLKNYTLHAKIEFMQEESFWKSPWIINSSFQLSKQIFLCSADFEIATNKYSGQITWTEHSFISYMQVNEKKILVINGKASSDEINVLVGLNIYQNFELNFKLLPYKQLYLKFYWDKDNDLRRNFFLTLSNKKNGFYVMAMEYPTQRIIAAFTFLPTQVTLNVTWGIERSQKMYLKVGHNVYDVGGIWFGELETPFNYFEKQEFKLKYLVVKQNFEAETNISWRTHKINLMTAGSRSSSNIKGFLSLNTTLPEISKLGIAFSHTHNLSEMLSERKTDASFVYNQHEISAKSVWKNHGLNISSLFDISSSTNIIKPIYGVLTMTNNQTTNYLHCLFSWQGNQVSAEYKFENYGSYITINTPFKGIETTKLEYGLIRTPNELIIKIEINVLEQLNYILLKWKDEYNSVNDVQFELISPMTGIYKLFFKHSTLFGYLDEDLIVKQGKENDTILALQLSGNINSILDMKAIFSVKALGHSISTSILNTPPVSIIEAKFDNNSLTSYLRFTAIEDEITQITWSINSTLFADPIKLQYYHLQSEYYTLISIPNGYKLENILNIEYPYTNAKNDFQFKTPSSRGGFTYLHTFENCEFNKEIRGYFNNEVFTYSLALHLDKFMQLIDSLSLDVSTSLYESIKVRFKILQEDENGVKILKPLLYFMLNNDTKLNVTAHLKLDTLNGSLEINMHTSNNITAALSGNYDVKHNFISTSVNLGKIDGKALMVWNDTFNIFVYVKSNNTQEFLLNAKYEPNQFLVELELNKYDLASKITFTRNSDNIVFNANCKSSIPNWKYSSLLVNASTGMSQQYFLTVYKNTNFIIMTYDLVKISPYNIILNCNITSTFESIDDGYLNVQYLPTDGKYLVEGRLGEYKSNINASLELPDMTDINSMNIAGYFLATCTKENKSLIDIRVKTNNELLIRDDTIGITISFDTSHSKLNFTSFRKLDKSYKSTMLIKTDKKVYYLNFDLLLDDNITFVGNAVCPLGKIYSKINIESIKTPRYKRIETNILYKINSEKYVANILTNYYETFWCDSKFNITGPSDRYDGHVAFKISVLNNALDVLFKQNNNKKSLKCLLDMYNRKLINGSLVLSTQEGSDLLEQKLTINYDIESIKKKIILQYFPDISESTTMTFNLSINKENIEAYIDLPNKNKFISLHGSSTVKNNDISINYVVLYNKKKIAIEIFHINKDYTQTKIDVATTIKGWERTVFENTIDTDKIRIFLKVKQHYTSLIANKNALFNDMEFLSVQYNGEPLVIIWSGRDQSYLITSTRYVKYRLGIQYITNPCIYAFSILKDGENLLSFILQNTSDTNFIHFKGKLMAPSLLPNYSNVSFQLSADCKFLNSFEFTFYNKDDLLLELQWHTNNSNNRYVGHLKFRSQMPMLQAFEIRPYVKSDENLLLKSTISFVQYDITKLYVNEIVVPLKSVETKFIVSYPCDYFGQCHFHLHLNKSYAKFHCLSPIENWQNVTIVTYLQIKDKTLGNVLYLQKNFNTINVVSELELRKNYISGYLNMKHNIQRKLNQFLFSVQYEFKKQLNLEVICDLLGINVNLVRDPINIGKLTLMYDKDKIFINSSMSSDKFDFLISNDKVITNLTITKSIISPYSQCFDIFTFINSKQSKGKLIYDIEKTYKVTSFFVIEKLHNKIASEQFHFSALGNFESNNGSLKVSQKNDGHIDRDLEFTYHKNPYLQAKLLITNEGATSILSARYLSANSSLNTGLTFSHNATKVEANLRYFKTPDVVNVFLQFPLNLNDKFTFETILHTEEHDYSIKNILTWPKNQEIVVQGNMAFRSASKNVSIDMSSPYNKPLKVILAYAIDKDKASFFATSSLGQDNVTMTGIVIPKTYLEINATSPFAGYTNGRISAKFDPIKRVVDMYFMKENFTAEFEGIINASHYNIHEVYMVAKTPDNLNETFAKVQIKLDENTMKFNADITWRNKDFVVGLSYKPTDLYLNVDSDFEDLKKVRLSGQYFKNKNTYNVISDGYWNTVNIRFNSNINLNPNNVKIKSELKVGTLYEGMLDFQYLSFDTEKVLEFSAYFPTVTSDVYLKFYTTRYGEGALSHILLKTPFKSLHSLNMEAVTVNNKIDVKILSNMQNKSINAYIIYSNPKENELDVKLGFSVPEESQYIHAEGNINLYKYGNLKISVLNDNSLFNYNFTKTCEIIFTHSNQNNISKKLHLIYNNVNKYFEYFYLKNNISISHTPSKSSVYVNLPFIPIHKSNFFYIRNLTESTVGINLNHMILIEISLTNSLTNVIIKHVFPVDIIISYQKTPSGFIIIVKDSENTTILFNDIIINYINNKKKIMFSIESFVNVYKIEILKNLERVLIMSKKDFLLDLEHSSDLTKIHFLNNHTFIDDYVMCNVDITQASLSFVLEAPIISPINVTADVNFSHENNKSMNLCLGSGNECIFKGNVMFKHLLSNNFKNVRIHFLKFGKNIFNFNYLANQTTYNVEVFADIFQKQHETNFRVSLRKPYLIEIELLSPMLPNNGFAIQGMYFSNVFFFLGSKIPGLVIKPDEQYLLLYSKFRQKSILVHFESPHCNLISFLHFNTSWDFDIYKTLNEITIKSKFLDDISIIADFSIAQDGLDIRTHLRLPFLENFEKLDSEFHIHRDLNPYFYINLPNNKNYSTHINYINNKSEFHIDAGYCFGEIKSSMKVHINLQLLHLIADIYTPFENFKHFALGFHEPSSQYYVTFANINERLYEVDVEYQFDKDAKLLKIRLNTPFEEYKMYSVTFEHIHTSDTKSLRCSMFYPSLKREIGFRFSHKGKYTTNYKLSLPFPVNGFEHVSAVTNISNSNSVFSINAIFELNDHSGNCTFKYDTIDENKLKLYLGLDTSGNNNVLLSYRTDDNFKSLNSSVIFKDKSIWQQEYLSDNNILYLLCNTNRKSIKLDYRYLENYKFDLIAKIWNSFEPDYQLGGHLLLIDKISAGLYLPTRIVTFDEQYVTNETYEYYFLRLALNKNDAFGVKVLFSNLTENDVMHIESLINLELPFRTFEFYNDAKIFKPRKLENRLVLKWDTDNNSQFAWMCTFSDRTLESKITTNALDHDLNLRVDFSKLNTIPSLFKLQIEYSSEIDKLVEIEMYYDQKYEQNILVTERIFLMSHPASKINYSIKTNTMRTNKFANLTVLLQYMNYIINKPDNIKASLEIGHENFEITGLIETKSNNLFIYTKANAEANSKGLQTQLRVNDKDPLNMNYVYNFKEDSPSFTLSTGYGDTRTYTFFAGLPSKREISTRLTHNIYENEYIDGLLTIKLNTTSLLWVQLLWKNRLIEQFYKSVVSEYRDLKFVVEATGRQLIDVVDKDFGKKFVSDGKEIRKKITDYSYNEKEKISLDYKQFTENLEAACNNDVLYCKKIRQLKNYWLENNILRNFTEPLFKTIGKYHDNIILIFKQTYYSIKDIFDDIEETIKELEDIEKLKNNAKMLLKNSINDAKKSIKDMEILAFNLLSNFEMYINSLKNKSEEFFEPFLSLLDDFVAYFENKLAYLQILVLDLLDTVQHYAQNLRETQKIHSLYNFYLKYFNELQLLEIVESISDFFETMFGRVILDAKNVIEHYGPYLDIFCCALFGNYEDLNNLPEFADFKEIINDVYQRTVWIWNYHNILENIRSYVYKTSINSISFLNLLSNDNAGNVEYENILGQLDYVYRPDIGVIEVSQPLPFEWESFDKRPAFEQYALYQQILYKIDYITHNRFDFYRNTIRNYGYSFLKPKFSPPTSNFAMVVGKSHYVTFNNQYFDFAGDGSYLLASDFTTFSILITYEKKYNIVMKKSVSVISRKNKIDIQSDSTVLLNDKIIDLPLVVDDFLITREYETIVVDNYKSLQVSCNLYFDYCSVKLSEWLFGKIGGLLGTLDNEKVTDMTMPSGHMANSIEEFTQSWMIGDNLDNVNYSNSTTVVDGAIFTNHLLDTMCSLIFLDSKSLAAPCFSVVDPEPYYKMCGKEVRDIFKPTLCRALAAYKKQCEYHHVNIRIHNVCVSCQTENNTRDITEEIFDGNSPVSIDVVFIQELNCLRNLIPLSKKLNSELNSLGFTKNKFALVGYGGDSMIKPHVYMFNNNIWTNGSNIKPNSTLRLPRNTREKYMPEDAIKFASELNFRPAVSKMFVLIQCEFCEEMNKSPQIFNMLGEKDITLHVLKPKAFEGIEGDIVGIDANNRLLNKQGLIRNTTNTEKIIDQLKDMCSGLSLSTSGTVTDTDMLKNHKNLRPSWASFVAATARQSSCQKCKCVPNKNGVGKVECTRCMSPIVKQLLTEYEAQAMNF